MLNYQKTSKHKAKCFENGTCWQSIATHDLTGNLVQFPLGTVHQKKTTNSIVPWLLTNGKNAVGYWNGLWLASPHYPFWEQDLWCFLRWCLNSLRVTRTKRNSSVSQLFLYCRRTNLPPDRWQMTVLRVCLRGDSRFISFASDVHQ